MKNILIKRAINLFLICVFFQLFVLASAQSEEIAEGVTLTALTRDGKSAAISWAYQGDLICILSSESSTLRELLVMNSDGSNEMNITRLGYPFFAEWSWDGRKISYGYSNTSDSESMGGIFIYDLGIITLYSTI